MKSNDSGICRQDAGSTLNLAEMGGIRSAECIGGAYASKSAGGPAHSKTLRKILRQEGGLL
jgi:hypothetical protein